MKAIVCLIAMLGLATYSNGQIGQNLKNLKAEFGNNYTDGYTKTDEAGKNFYYLIYEDEQETLPTDTLPTVKVLYFFENKPDSFCAYWKICQSSSKGNVYLTAFNKDLRKIEDFMWKDDESNLIYTLLDDDGVCVITCYPDFKNR